MIILSPPLPVIQPGTDSISVRSSRPCLFLPKAVKTNLDMYSTYHDRDAKTDGSSEQVFVPFLQPSAEYFASLNMVIVGCF